MCTLEWGLIRKCLPMNHRIIVLTCSLLFYNYVFIADAVKSEVGLIHKDDVDWFLTLNKTHYDFSTMGTKGGAMVGRYINPLFLRSGEQCIVSNFHTMGVYGTTLRGEPLPLLYILSTASIKENDYKINPCLCEGLPPVVTSCRKGHDMGRTHGGSS